MNTGRRTLGLVGGNRVSPGLTWEASPVSFVSLNSFQITGRDAANDYVYGTPIYIPGGGWAGSLGVMYTGGNSIALVSDNICFSGMASVGRVSSRINQATLCYGGTPISGGVCAIGTVPPAFDGIIDVQNSSFFSSLQYGNGVSGVAWLGYQFASAISPAWFRLTQPNGSTSSQGGTEWANFGIRSVLWQYSDNGSSWTTQNTVNNIRMDIPHLAVVGPPASPHAYWRILANANPPSNDSYTHWGVLELQIGV